MKLRIPNQWKYEVMKKEFDRDDTGVYTAYGIMVFEGEALEPCDAVHDVTLDEEIAINMVKKFNAYQLSPLHLREVIENMLE